MTTSEQRRHELEAAEYLRWPLEKRQAQLRNIEKKRGSAACDRLKQEMIRQHRLAKKEKPEERN